MIDEVDNIGSDRNLPIELIAAEPAIAQAAPDFLFGSSWSFAHGLGADVGKGRRTSHRSSLQFKGLQENNLEIAKNLTHHAFAWSPLSKGEGKIGNPSPSPLLWRGGTIAKRWWVRSMGPA
jgi:hypothetical protein